MRIISMKFFSAFLCCVLLLQCSVTPVFAAPSDPKEFTIISDEIDENGNYVPTYVVDSRGRRVEPDVPVRAAEDDLPAAYDLRTQGIVTPIKQQAGTGSCWAFSTIACLESSYILQGLGTVDNTDFSEAHLTWFGNRCLVTDTSDPTCGDGFEHDNPFLYGGTWRTSSSTILRGSGLQLEANAPWIETYDTSEMLGMAQDEADRYVSYARLWKAENIPVYSVAAIKQKLLENGPVLISYYDDGNPNGTTYYNKTYYSFYQTYTSSYNHGVTIVGWDDNFPVDHFNIQPPSPGAWLVKGSWSTLYGDGGYYWISYEDPSISEITSFVAAPVDIYENIYQYDGSYCNQYLIGTSSTASFANLFTAKGTEQLTHVEFFSYDEHSTTATAEIYVDDGAFTLTNNDPTYGMRKVDAATVTIDDLEPGFRTLALTHPVNLHAGQKFTVKITMQNPDGQTIKLPVEGRNLTSKNQHSANEGESFLYFDQWYDSVKYSAEKNYHNVPVKAMSKTIVLSEPTLTVTNLPVKTVYQEDETLDTTGLVLTYTNEYNESFEITEGYSCDLGTLSMPGRQTITVTYGGAETSFTVRVMQKPLDPDDPDSPALEVSSATGHRGSTIDVTIRTKNNPGIVATRLFVTYDPTVLTLTDVTNGTVIRDEFFHADEELTAVPYTVLWVDPLGTTDYRADDTLVTLTFTIREDAADGVSPITLAYDDISTFNADLDARTFIIRNGSITVGPRIAGDTNNDGSVDLRDAAAIRRYLAGGWSGLRIDDSNADVNADNLINLKDAALICRYLADGWDVVLA